MLVGRSEPSVQIATAFVANGAKVRARCIWEFCLFIIISPQVYISSRSAKDCDATAAELNALGAGSCIPIPADMQKLSEVERLVSQLSSREQSLHVLVNNAGAAWGDTFDDYPVRDTNSFPRSRAHTNSTRMPPSPSY